MENIQKIVQLLIYAIEEEFNIKIKKLEIEQNNDSVFIAIENLKE